MHAYFMGVRPRAQDSSGRRFGRTVGRVFHEKISAAGRASASKAEAEPLTTDERWPTIQRAPGATNARPGCLFAPDRPYRSCRNSA